jgi:hypothetical protein
MHARVTLLELDPVRTSVEAAVALFERDVLPHLREHEGYEGIYVLTTPEGRAMLLTLWRTREAAEESAGFAREALAAHATLFAAPPGRELYTVAVADLPALV